MPRVYLPARADRQSAERWVLQSGCSGRPRSVRGQQAQPAALASGGEPVVGTLPGRADSRCRAGQLEAGGGLEQCYERVDPGGQLHNALVRLQYQGVRQPHQARQSAAALEAQLPKSTWPLANPVCWARASSASASCSIGQASEVRSTRGSCTLLPWLHGQTVGAEVVYGCDYSISP